MIRQLKRKDLVSLIVWFLWTSSDKIFKVNTSLSRPHIKQTRCVIQTRAYWYISNFPNNYILNIVELPVLMIRSKLYVNLKLVSYDIESSAWWNSLNLINGFLFQTPLFKSCKHFSPSLGCPYWKGPGPTVQFPAQEGFQHVAQEWMVKSLYTLTGYFSYSLSYNHGQKLWDTFAFPGVFQFTQQPRSQVFSPPHSVGTSRRESRKRGCSHRPTPFPHPTNNVGRMYTEFFSAFQLCTGWVEEELQENFKKNTLFYEGTQNDSKIWILHYCPNDCRLSNP